MITLVTKFSPNLVKIPALQNISHFFSQNLVMIGVWEVGDLFGETFFTKFGENILHLVTKNVQNLVKTKGQNMVKMPVLHLNW